jgi:NAD(P)-dependent dehydrogenase (short-subunit alcohol dehydrogenase family)
MNKRILITGTSKGLGLALANQYLNQGATVVGISRNTPPIESVNYFHLSASVTEIDFHSKLEKYLNDLPIDKIDIVINNAGSAGKGEHLSETNPDDILQQVDLHCIGAFRVVKAARQYLGQSKIVNVTSRLGSITQTVRGDFKERNFSYGYRIAKCAQNMLSLCLAGDSELEGLIVISINPGLLLTACGASDAQHSAEVGAEKFIKVVNDVSKSGIYHAFAEEAFY